MHADSKSAGCHLFFVSKVLFREMPPPLLTRKGSRQRLLRMGSYSFTFYQETSAHRLLTKDRKCLPGLAHVVTVRMKEPHYVRLPGTERKAKDFSTTQNQSHNHTGFGSSLQNEVKINLIKLFWKINEINYVRALCNLWSSVVKSVINRRQ